MAKRWFSTLLPSRSGAHYVLPGSDRLPGARERIERGEYFGVHGAPQSGRTTALLGLADELTRGGRFAALHVSCKDAAASWDAAWAARSDKLVEALWMASARLDPALRPPGGAPGARSRGGADIGEVLSAWARACPRPIALFLDDAQALPAQALSALFARIAAGAPQRPRGFPWSLVVCDSREAERRAKEGGVELPPIPNSIELRRFTLREVRALLGQHTTETGQAFTDAASREIKRLSRGDPLPVNMLARYCIEELGLSPQTPITPSHVAEAKDRMLRTHFTFPDETAIDSAAAAREAERASRGRGPGADGRPDRRHRMPVSPVAWRPDAPSPILREVLERNPRLATERLIEGSMTRHLLPDGRLSLRRVLREIAALWRRHGEALVREAIRPDEAPLAVVFALLERAVTLEKEARWMGPKRGRGPTFRLASFSYRKPDGTQGQQTWILDVRVQREGQSSRRQLGIARLRRNLRRTGRKRATLIVLDVRGRIGKRRPILEDVTTPEGHVIHVYQL